MPSRPLKLTILPPSKRQRLTDNLSLESATSLSHATSATLIDLLFPESTASVITKSRKITSQFRPVLQDKRPILTWNEPSEARSLIVRYRIMFYKSDEANRTQYMSTVSVNLACTTNIFLLCKPGQKERESVNASTNWVIRKTPWESGASLNVHFFIQYRAPHCVRPPSTSRAHKIQQHITRPLMLLLLLFIENQRDLPPAWQHALDNALPWILALSSSQQNPQNNHRPATLHLLRPGNHADRPEKRLLTTTVLGHRNILQV